MDIEEILNMQIGEVKDIVSSGADTDVVRIPGGYLYRTWYSSGDGVGVSTAFVPDSEVPRRRPCMGPK